MMGYQATRLQIKQESWFRSRWHRRNKMTGDLRKAMDALK
jgi:hypothetical protein